MLITAIHYGVVGAAKLAQRVENGPIVKVVRISIGCDGYVYCFQAIQDPDTDNLRLIEFIINFKSVDTLEICAVPFKNCYCRQP